MSENETKKEMIQVEQQELDSVIKILEKDKQKLENKIEQCEYSKDVLQNPYRDEYDSLCDNNDRIQKAKEQLSDINIAMLSLYEAHVKISAETNGRESDLVLRIGKHKYSSLDNKKIIYSWTDQLCKHYIGNSFNNENIKYTFVREKQFDEVQITNYCLQSKRKLEINNKTVKDVIQLYPMFSKKGEKVIFDSFLQELSKRRNETEFSDIIFSIQEQQKKIIYQPYNENLIVQGCAGSGKSMIMLHRLPILLQQHSDYVKHTNVYIISPTKEYINMANNMMESLEILDVRIGTLNQYYDFVIQKYSKSIKKYGIINYHLKVEKNTLDYVYSEQCVEDILTKINDKIKKYVTSLQKYGILLKNDYDVNTAGKQQINKIVIRISKFRDEYIRKHKEELDLFIKNYESLVSSFERAIKNIENELETSNNSEKIVEVNYSSYISECLKSLQVGTNPKQTADNWKE